MYINSYNLHFYLVLYKFIIIIIIYTSMHARVHAHTLTLSSAKTESPKKGPRNESFSSSIPTAWVMGSGNQLLWRTI